MSKKRNNPSSWWKYVILFSYFIFVLCLGVPYDNIMRLLKYQLACRKRGSLDVEMKHFVQIYELFTILYGNN